MISKLAAFVLLFNLLVLSSISSIESKCEKNSTVDVKTYVIDLDLPPRERYKQVVTDHKLYIWEWFSAEKKAINPLIFKVFEDLASKLDVVHHFPYPFNEEFMGIAEALADYNATYGDIVIFNLIYDFTAFCTGIIAQQKDGQIIHGRNFDYDVPQYLQKITYTAKFVKNGKLVFTSAHLAGFVGVITGHKHNAFTFSINERDQGEWYLNVITALVDKNSTPLSFLTRNLMENITNFNDAVTYLSKTDLIAPAYFIVGGLQPYEGVVITRSQFEVVNLWHLNASSSGIESWYLLETNYDHWLPSPPNDDRRTPGMKAMNATTQANINFTTLFDVLTIYPVCNNETAYSVVMSAKDYDTDGFKIIVH